MGLTGEEDIMNRPLLAASTLTTAVGLALAMQAPIVHAQGMKDPPQIVKDNMAKMAKDKLEKCYGINAASKNDCAEGAHSCAGQATQAPRHEILRAAPGGRLRKDSGWQDHRDLSERPDASPKHQRR
jgi:uncharacterized membrane protein